MSKTQQDYQNDNILMFSKAGRLFDRLGGGLSAGGGNGTSGGMEARVAKLEADSRAVQDGLIRIETKLDSKPTSTEMAKDFGFVRADIAELKGKVSQLPTTIQMLGFVVAIVAAAGIVRHFFP